MLNRPNYWGEDRVFFRDRHSCLRSVPTQWTSLAPRDPFVALAAGRAFFRVEDLCVLAELLEHFDERGDAP